MKVCVNYMFVYITGQWQRASGAMACRTDIEIKTEVVSLVCGV
jgi:hypothetical protein